MHDCVHIVVVNTALRYRLWQDKKRVTFYTGDCLIEVPTMDRFDYSYQNNTIWFISGSVHMKFSMTGQVKGDQGDPLIQVTA